MSPLGWASTMLQVAGLGLVVFGLYRSDPKAQAVVSRNRAWLRRNVLRRRSQVLEGQGVGIHVAVGVRARGVVPPPQRSKTGAPEERLDWVEHAIDLIYDEITAESEARAAETKATREAIEALRWTLISDREELARSSRTSGSRNGTSGGEPGSWP